MAEWDLASLSRRQMEHGFSSANKSVIDSFPVVHGHLFP